MDSPPEAAFDRLTRLAANLLAAPVALVSLVDAHRQFFKSSFGLPLRETPLSHSFCKQVVRDGTPLVVHDARHDARVADNPAIDELGVQAYLGVPLVTAQGHTLGALCTIDHQPRRWTERDAEILGELAALVMTETALRARTTRLERQSALLATILDSLEETVVAVDKHGRTLLFNRAARASLGEPQTSTDPAEWVRQTQVFLPDQLTLMPPDRLPLVRALAGEEVSAELVFLQSPQARGRWHAVNARPLRDVAGAVIGAVTVGRDVTDEKDLQRALASEQSDVRALLDVATIANTAHDAEDALRQAIARICRAVCWPVGHVYLKVGGELVPSDLWHLGAGRYDAFREATRKTRQTPERGLIGEVARTGLPAWLTELRNNPRFSRSEAARRCGLQTGFAAPILIGSEVVAVIELFTTEKRTTVVDVLSVVPEAAMVLGRVFERARASRAAAEHVETLHQLSIRDPLTGLLNRRGFTLLAEPALALMRRHRRPALVLCFDVEGLEQGNGHDGHAASDQLICAAAAALSGTFRGTDVVARIGGDEFVVFCQESGSAELDAVRARLQAQLARVGLSRTSPLAWSHGVAVTEPDGEASLDALIRAADQAMYDDKQRRHATRP